MSDTLRTTKLQLGSGPAFTYRDADTLRIVAKASYDNATGLVRVTLYEGPYVGEFRKPANLAATMLRLKLKIMGYRRTV